jgi:CRP/FNR family transcriptional regulator, cyclic AMP receptor protein
MWPWGQLDTTFLTVLENRCVPGSHTPFLRQLSAADSEALVALSRRRVIRKSEPIMRAGSAGDFAAIVLQGRVKFVAYGNDRREVVLALRGPGELIGEMAALGHQPRSATAIAVDEVEIGYLSSDQLRAFFSEHPDAAIVLVRMLVSRLTEADSDRVGLATQDSVGRIAKRLLELVAEHGTRVEGGVRIELVLTQGELASWTGATRETVSRALRMMRRLGWIAIDRRRIVVLDQDALRERAGASSPGGP